jgi:hypothetical protein
MVPVAILTSYEKPLTMGLDWRPIARKGAKHARLPIGISKAIRTVDLWEVLEDKFDVDHYTGHDRAIDILI